MSKLYYSEILDELIEVVSINDETFTSYDEKGIGGWSFIEDLRNYFRYIGKL